MDTQSIRLEPANPAFDDRIDARQPPQGPAARLDAFSVRAFSGEPGQRWVNADDYDATFAALWTAQRERDEARAERDAAREKIEELSAANNALTARFANAVDAADVAADDNGASANLVAALRARIDELETRHAAESSELDESRHAATLSVDREEALEALTERHAALVGAVRAAMVIAEGSGPA